MFAVATGSPGTASVDVLKTGGPDVHGSPGALYVTTNANGAFTITTADFQCGSGGVAQQIYLYSSGGNPGMTAGTNNTGAGLMAVLGACTNNAFSPTLPSVQMDEVTTVAAGYTLAPFATDPTHISISGSALSKTGLANAVAMAGMLAAIGTGKALEPGIYGAAVQEKINSLANSLAACVNTTGNTSSNCNKLLPFAGNASDTAQAVINIAKTGGGTTADITSIFDAATAYPQFTPNLGNAPDDAPNDWTLAVTYDGNLNGAQDIAIDASGNAYVTEEDNNDVIKFTPFGVRSGSPFTDSGLSSPDGIAIDSSGNVWVTNFSCIQVTPEDCDYYLSEFTSTGASVGSSPFTNAAFSQSFNVAVDGSGHIWRTEFGNSSLSEVNPSSGALIYNSTTMNNNNPGHGSDYGGLNGPDGIAIDPGTAGNIWVTNPDGVSGTTISGFGDAGANSEFLASSPYTGTGTVGPISNAIDSSGRIWTSNYGGSFSNVSGSSITMFSANGMTSTSYQGGGVNGPYGGAYSVAIDGAGNVWTANLGVDQPPDDQSYIGGSISEYNPTTSSFVSNANGFLYGLNNGANQAESDQPDFIAIDGSGNVWVVNNGDGTLNELVGAATPVATPLVTAVKNSQLGARP
jgi:hypothetical protein